VETSDGVKSLDKILVRSNGSVTYTGKDVAISFGNSPCEQDFLYKAWGPQANGKVIWTTDPEGETGDRLPRRLDTLTE